MLDADGDAKKGRVAAAIKDYEEAIQTCPEDALPYWQLNALLPRDNPKAAEALWDKMWQEMPDNGLAALLCGIAREANYDHPGAQRALEAALRLGGDDWNVCVRAGDAYSDMEAWPQAVAAYDRALALNPALGRQRPLIAQGCLDEQLGDISGAVDNYRAAILVNPASSEPYWRLEAAHPKSSLGAMLGLWGGILEQIPENAVVDVLLAENLAEVKPCGSARTMLHRALQLDGNDSNVLVHAGNAYVSMEAWTEAVTAYERAIGFNPGLSYVYSRLETARQRQAKGGGTPPVEAVRPS